MAAVAAERLLPEGEGGSMDPARLSPPPPPPQQPPPARGEAQSLEQLPQSNTLVGLPVVAIEGILGFLSYDETSQLRLVRDRDRDRVWGRGKGEKEFARARPAGGWEP